MRTTLFCSAVDVADAGAAQVLSDACERAGVDGLSIATSYHAARDLHPHARGRRVRHLAPVTPRLLDQRGHCVGGLGIGGELRCDCTVRPELRIDWEP